jgi:hypothetical protein
MGPHLDFCAAAGRQVTVSDVNGCHEIAENIPQRSRAPVMFRWACAQIERSARDDGRSGGGVLTL